MKKFAIALISLGAVIILLQAAVVGSKHDFNRPGQGRVCVYCHTVHGAKTSSNTYYLWSRNYVPSGPFVMYDGRYTDPMTNASYHTYLCLSCHDGTITTTNLGQLNIFGQLVTRNIGTGVQDPPDITAPYGSPPPAGAADTLTGSHPVDMDVAPGILPSSDFTAPSTWPGNNLPLFDFSSQQAGADSVVTCATCHEPHNVGTVVADLFLRADTLNSQICTTCHIK